MLDMDATTIGKMIFAYREGGMFDFYVYEDKEFVQPFCGIYTAGGLSKVYARAIKGELREFSLRSMIGEGKTKRIKIDGTEAFGNYNTF
jgi:molybdopterin-guanine dinucleotide biosynthesis protein A